MAILVDHEIREALNDGLTIQSPTPLAIGPCSIDLMLSPHFRLFEEKPFGERAYAEGHDIDPREDNSTDGLGISVPEGDYFLLRPMTFALASTVEHIAFPSNIAGQMEGKSSLARLGLIVHVTAGFFDVGFAGYPTLELFNLRHRPIRLYPGMPIAQMAFFRTSSYARVPYGARGDSKYHRQGAAPAPSQ